MSKHRNDVTGGYAASEPPPENTLHVAPVPLQRSARRVWVRRVALLAALLAALAVGSAMGNTKTVTVDRVVVKHEAYTPPSCVHALELADAGLNTAGNLIGDTGHYFGGTLSIDALSAKIGKASDWFAKNGDAYRTDRDACKGQNP